MCLKIIITVFFSITVGFSQAQVVFCDSFDDSTVISQSDIFHTFIYHQNTWLSHWYPTDGTPSIFNNSSLPGVVAYEGIQYTGIGICGGNNGCDGLELLYNFQANQTYHITLAVRNWNNYQAVMTFYLLPVALTHTYDSTRGCSNEYCGTIPLGAMQVFSSSPPNQWGMESFSFTPVSSYQSLWFSISSPNTIPNGSAAIYCLDSLCLSLACYASVNLGNDTTICSGRTVTLDASTPGATYLWNTGSTNQTISVNTAGVYWVEVTAGGCTMRDSIVVTQNPLPLANLGNDTSLCTAQTLLFDATDINSTYRWQDNSTNSTFIVNSPGSYSVTVTNVANCTASDAVNITYTSQPPVVALGKDTSVCNSEGLLMKPGIRNVQYHWQDNSTDSVYRVTSSGVYSVTVSDGCGTASDKINVEIHADECVLMVPTAFSPNNDGTNDVFRAFSRCGTKQYTTRIYNRWGELVFESDDVSEGWDGTFRNTPQPLGVFVYYYEYFNYCDNKLKKIVGNVSLIR